MRFWKYHALGNDYFVLDGKEIGDALRPALVRLLCHRHFGLGGNGLLVHRRVDDDQRFHLGIFNPDGSEAEISGNGLRIFSRYLWDRHLVGGEPFAAVTLSGEVRCRVLDEGSSVAVGMGRVSFRSTEIPVTGADREVLDETIVVGGEALPYCSVSVGNPHCVILGHEVSEAEARRLGPLLERHPNFPHRINVQLVEITSRKSLRLEIWERGAGYTLASGSSSCAAAAVTRRLGLTDRKVEVWMPGGAVSVAIADDWSVTLTGPVSKVAEGQIASELWRPAQ